jgi:exocyst complex protein 7
MISSPRKGDLGDYIASLDRSTQTLSELKRSNLRANQQAVKDLSSLLDDGTRKLEREFGDSLRESCAGNALPLECVLKSTAQLFPRSSSSSG